MKPNEEVEAISKKFGIRVKHMEIIQNGVYKIMTTKGKEYCLKRMAYSPVRLRWIDKTLRRLRRRGFTKIVWRNPKRHTGKHLFVKRSRQSPPFVLHPWVKGKWPSPKSSVQMKKCGILLAKFHQFGSKIAIPKEGINNQMGKWASYLRREQKLLQQAVHKARHHQYPPYAMGIAVQQM